MAFPTGHGAQVRLDGDQQAAARGVASSSVEGNAAVKRVLELTGLAPDGSTPDGSTRTGAAAIDPPASPVVIRRVLPRLQIVGSRGQALGQDTNGALGGAGGTNYTRAESRFRSVIGPEGASDLRLLYGNYIITAGSGDQVGPNALTVEAALELQTGTPNSFAAQWNGQDIGSIGIGAAHALTDAVPLDVPGGGFVWMRTGITVTAGQQWPRGYTASATGEKAAESTAATSQISSQGPLATPAGGAAANGFGPLALLGIPTRAMPAVIILGDSIADGSGDSGTGDAEGNRGFARRGLRFADGSVIPYHASTKPSDNPLALRIHQSWRRHVPWQYANWLLNEHGGNQLSSVTVSAMLGYLQLIWDSAHRRNMKVCQVLLGPRTTGSWTSAASQTGFNADFEPGGKRDQLNNLIRAAYAAGVIEAIIDPNQDWEDPANPGKWVTTGAADYATADGTHPSAAMAIAAAARVRAWAATLTA